MPDNLINQITNYYNDGPWIVQICVVVFLVLLATFIENRFLNRLHNKLKNTGTHWDHAFLEALRKPLVAFFWVIGITIILKIIKIQTGFSLVDAIKPIRNVSGDCSCFLVSGSLYQNQ